MLKLVTPPATPVVSLAEAKSHLRVFHNDDDAYIEALVDVAIGMIDGADGWLGRALVEQTWEYSIDRFPCSDERGHAGRVHIPLAPLMSVSSVEYTASDGTSLAASGIRTFGDGSTLPGYVLPAVGTSWPSTLCEPESVRITFVAGYEDVPAGIKHAILLMVGHWYENREDVSDGKLAEMPMASKALLMPHRNWRG
ncbi:head-tail connector protein [Rhizobium leguminosarum]|uniref:head-tail connector protein n=1 Tax=Rhizobium leguminosarum TaxID=384 RepID=UPI001FDFE039|nr:head-tail connector protein [Rhizobium leguminosarum]